MERGSQAGSHIARATGERRPKKRRLTRISFSGEPSEVDSFINEKIAEGFTIREKRSHSFLPGQLVVVLIKYER